MTADLFVQLAGVAAFVTGPALIAVTIISVREIPRFESLYLVNVVAILVAVAGLFFYQRVDAMVWMLLAFISLLVGNLAWALPGVFAQSTVYIVSSLGYAAGLILLAIGSLIAGLLPIWVPILWLAALIAAIPGFIHDPWTLPAFLLGAVLIAVGFVGAGARMLALA